MGALFNGRSERLLRELREGKNLGQEKLDVQKYMQSWRELHPNYARDYWRKTHGAKPRRLRILGVKLEFSYFGMLSKAEPEAEETGGTVDATPKPKKYRRWNPAKPDPAGAARGSDSGMFTTLNERVMNGIHDHALKVNERLKRRKT